ncbi:hypothetical protein BD311DRAFT_406685 [Dichomitus squalens]|uniref:Uncharacterized protein n=1 Tax=Dichomitus squalens TaxID=114155 RepID=A0A4V2K011_9APHY|nr:hypothetical protein BD311DRAFT_406685 [Dichomitus squalens]
MSACVFSSAMCSAASSPRDHLESLAYTNLHLLSGTLPWSCQPLDKRKSTKHRKGALQFRVPQCPPELLTYRH